MASQSKTKTVKFEVGQQVLFSGHRVGQVSRIAKNGAIYVIVIGETTVADQTREELRVKKADLQLVNDVLERAGDAVSVEDYVRHVIRNNISCAVSSNAEMADNGTYELAPDYIPSPGCLEYCKWEGSADAARVLELVGIDLVKLANLYTGKPKVEGAEIPQDPPPVVEVEFGEAAKPIEDDAQEIAPQQASVVQESIAPMGEPIQSTLELESTEESQSVALAEATYALRELTFSVTRHSILTAFIDMALNKDIPGYNYQVASNIKNLMAAAFDPVHDPMGYARINTWTMAALELVLKNKARVAKMLNQPIEAAPVKIDRVTKLGMWLDKNMSSNGATDNDLTSAYDSCYMYDAVGKKLEAYTFVVVEVIQSGDQGEASVIPLPWVGKESTPFQEYLTAQAAIAWRKHCIDYYRPTEPDLHLYCGIVPILKTGLATKEAVEKELASVIDSLKGLND